MNKQRVLEQFAALAGLSVDEAMSWSGSADLAIAAVRAELREGADRPENDPLLEYLCGAACYYGYALRMEKSGDETVRTLDFTVSRKGGGLLRAASALRDNALALAHGLLKDSRFFFGRAG